MPRSTYSAPQAQRELPRLVRDAEARAVVGIERQDETVAYLVSRGHLEAIVETMELLTNPKAVRAIEAHRARRTRFVSLSALDAE